MSARELITDHLDLWTSAVTTRSTAGRGSSSGKRGKIELTGIKKLRELILELAVRGKLVDQDPSDEPASVLLERISEEKARLVKEGKIKKPKKLPAVELEEEDFELPSSWLWVRLGSVGQILGGGTPKSGEPSYWAEKGVSWLTPADLYGINEKYIESGKRDISRLGLEKSSAQLLPEGAVLFSSRAPIGYVAIAAKALATNQGFKSCAPYVREVSQFVYYFLKRSARHIDASASGTTFKEVSGSKVASIAMPLPPLEEQRRIVEKVDELMALCDRLEQQVGDQLEAHEVLVDTLLDALTRSTDAGEVVENWARIAEHFDTLFTTEASIEKLKQTILQLAVMGRLVEQNPDDEPASLLLERIAEEKARLVNEGKIRKQKPLPEIAGDEYPFEIPAGWVVSRMDDITDIQSGIAKGKKHTGKKTTWLPYLRVANVQRGRLDLSEVKEIEISCDETEKYSVKKRDLLITEGGDWDKVGRTAIWNAAIDPMAHQNHVFRARLILDEQNEKWIEKYLNSGFSREYFAGSSKQTTNLASINKTQLRSSTVPVPPIEEQRRIIEKIDELMAICDRLKARLGEAGDTRTRLAEAVVEQAVS
ncbi:restriction endonuclease subunit S [Halomonas sp.]|uniref:restriction endonuclease subunit S n=1 Tax=Halomonas sp. TaxID=1486246 RepID=UPI003850D1CF